MFLVARVLGGHVQCGMCLVVCLWQASSIPNLWHVMLGDLPKADIKRGHAFYIQLPPTFYSTVYASMLYSVQWTTLLDSCGGRHLPPFADRDHQMCMMSCPSSVWHDLMPVLSGPSIGSVSICDAPEGIGEELAP